MIGFSRTRYRAEIAAQPGSVAAAIALRGRVFRGSSAPDADRDAFDDFCDHILIRRNHDGRLVGCTRMRATSRGHGVMSGYAAQFYDLSRLTLFPGTVLEVGRFCIDPEIASAELLFCAWGALAGYAQSVGARLVIGCSSFPGADPEKHAACLGQLWSRHLAPKKWRPDPRPGNLVRPDDLKTKPVHERAALLQMPPLLRSYLTLGAWVSDHAVIDHDLDTLHVFTGLQIDRIPAPRLALLRRAAMDFRGHQGDRQRLVG